jgi:hypothetical protein
MRPGGEVPSGRRDAQAQQGAVTRALLWLLGGVLVGVGLMLAVAPELVAQPGELGQLGLLVVAAGVPGLIVLLAVVRRRRRLDERER